VLAGLFPSPDNRFWLMTETSTGYGLPGAPSVDWRITLLRPDGTQQRVLSERPLDAQAKPPSNGLGLAAFSPDGKQVAYECGTTGIPDLCVDSVDPPSG